MKFAAWLIAIVSVLLSGCSATGPVFQERADTPTDSAVIYVYRPDALVNSGGYPNLFINGVDQGPLYNNGYIPVDVKAGTVSIVLKGDWTKWGTYEPIGIQLNAIEKRKYYVRFGNQLGAFIVLPSAYFASTNIAIQEVSEQFGANEITKTKLCVDSSKGH